jgi:hypothetical protein
MLCRRGLVLLLVTMTSGCGGPQTDASAAVDEPAADEPAAGEPAAGAPEGAGAPTWERREIENFRVFSVETPAPLVEDYEWAGEYLGPGRLFVAVVGDARYAVRASRVSSHGGEMIRRALEARTAAGCSVEEAPVSAVLDGAVVAPAAAQQWTVECDGVVARIRHFAFESAACGPGHGVSLVVVGADEDDATRFLGSLRSGEITGC